MFLKATEVRLANAKAKLEVNKKFYDNSKEMEGFKSNPECLKAMRDVLVESQKSHVVWSKVAVKIAKENVNIAKKRGPVFAEITKNYIGFDRNIGNTDNAKTEDSASVERFKTNKENEKCVRLFDSQVEAIEIFLKYFEQNLEVIEKKFKMGTFDMDVDEPDLEKELEKIDSSLLESEKKLTKAKVELAKACLKSAKAGNVAFEEIAKILPKNSIYVLENIFTVKTIDDYDGLIKFTKDVIKYSKDKVRKSQDELKSLRAYIKDVENNAKSNVEAIDILKYRLKVVEMQVNNLELNVKRGEVFLKILNQERKRGKL
ncbi:MAG: hypothetical protein LBB44_03125 [Endomicrobium sp.]|nr:hypothetical protein [Endomicrobium sp.]